jgi:hypothetical protein
MTKPSQELPKNGDPERLAEERASNHPCILSDNPLIYMVVIFKKIKKRPLACGTQGGERSLFDKLRVTATKKAPRLWGEGPVE